MDEYINKIYARVNQDNVVTHIFSEAFEQPLITDICIDATNTDRHGAQNYEVVDENGFYNYYIDGSALMVRNKLNDQHKNANNNKIAELKSKLLATDYQAIKYAEGQISEVDYAPIKAQRQAWRDEINRLEQGGAL